MKNNSDILIHSKINNYGMKFDAVVGIKTGGAVISDYVSKKLGIKNYKIKISKSQYGCDKKPIDAVMDSYQKEYAMDTTTHTICEPINDNIEGQNILLLDEMVSSGSTMMGAYKYITEQKKANAVMSAIFVKSDSLRLDLDVLHVYDSLLFVWPWGWDN